MDQGPLNWSDAHASFLNPDISCCLLDYSGLTLTTLISSLNWSQGGSLLDKYHLRRRSYVFPTRSMAFACWPLVFDLIGQIPSPWEEHHLAYKFIDPAEFQLWTWLDKQHLRRRSLSSLHVHEVHRWIVRYHNNKILKL